MLLNPFDDQPAEFKAKAAFTLVLLGAANLGVWLWAFDAFAGRPALLGTAFLAYMFGLRHAFDADHIAAIDNVVRKLVQSGKKPLSVGFFFSLGHSTIVVAATVLIALTVSTFQDRQNALQAIGGVVGTLVSSLFLIAIGLANLVVLRSIFAAFQRARRGEEIGEEDLDGLLRGRGLLARIFRPLFRVVTRSWHLYPIGFLFGLGFDTATEIGLLGISASQAAQGLSLWSILVFPALFTAGMSLMDTLDSMLMTGAYGWASVKPLRKLWYNLTITAASVAVAIFIGGIEALGLAADELNLTGRFWDLIGHLNDNLADLGYVLVGIFALSWLVSTVIYRARGYDDAVVDPQGASS
ncbi:HoxN/HupN/NixA family nickel/cobalt transporter [Jiella sp. MQZ9-1]|uniref:Nickel/cobalt efflux system n=1 Tax=Jiella flava TaxID=2816857 RepID=A0A939FU14_9HYPH|nr:HoxN/HupN/NixA family nickel/cobalt transporter [Jiella flava]MBO0661542.1 HoxN/HupN/NixA family nickel/cobalt transporter [Jiella flava]MCD2470184.1 HoxN/HupN/NixA family nickel/cobalt transporter [Jiella flava]